MNTRVEWQAQNGKLDGIVVENENSWLCWPFGPLPRRASLALKLIVRLRTVQQVNNIMTLLSQLDSLNPLFSIMVFPHDRDTHVKLDINWWHFQNKEKINNFEEMWWLQVKRPTSELHWLTAFSWKPNQCVDKDPSRDRFVYSTWPIYLSNEHAMFGWNGSYWVA